MKILLSLVSYASLALLTLPAFFFLSGSLSLDTVKLLMLIATILWYVVTPLWMDQKKQEA